MDNKKQHFTLDILFRRNRVFKSPKPKEKLVNVGNDGGEGKGRKECRLGRIVVVRLLLEQSRFFGADVSILI